MSDRAEIVERDGEWRVRLGGEWESPPFSTRDEALARVPEDQRGAIKIVHERSAHVKANISMKGS